ncbi:hypothetical protein GGP41_004763 [Bipolaris sorokiniana]|uniref:Uncharacterized protein n=2 Tax=Cochliobolus sativus TaxID=45130 RepID=A0A8H5ZC97_COCSA|nr:uncharacterized protein COCSADRAFT_76750 [Bipolaris sorokiniana ND90Pr]EMD69225.1 hypothetical protein COCSADRAFT_76750 [Bipolaris sorokiniana ND90Pr]KAF5846696.1 hypothetical protein GGP41_004763 [Bipolaris sorokiniana]
MPPAKKQKSSRHSGVSTQDAHSDSSDSAFESVRPRKNNKRKSTESASDESQNASKRVELEKLAPYDYVCIPRPLFDVEGENWLTWSINPSAHVEEEDVYNKLYKPKWEQEKKDGVYMSPPENHPGRKWVMMWGAWLKRNFLIQKAEYCDPDNFHMHIYTDWTSWGIIEIGENMMIEFNKAYQSKEPTRLEEMWVIISAVGLWLNEGNCVSQLIEGEAEDVPMFIGLLGCALLTTLAAVEKAGELKPDSRFIDLALVIAYYMEVSYDLPAYGVEGDCVAWRKHVVSYFEKGNLDPAKGLSTTKLRIEKLKKVNNYNEEADVPNSVANLPVTYDDNPVLKLIREEDNGKENEHPKATDKTSGSSNLKSSKGKNTEKEDDVWNWVKVFQTYKKRREPIMGGEQYDITKMTRAERAKWAFNHKDPLADIPAKDLKNNLVDFKP